MLNGAPQTQETEDYVRFLMSPQWFIGGAEPTIPQEVLIRLGGEVGLSGATEGSGVSSFLLNWLDLPNSRRPLVLDFEQK